MSKYYAILLPQKSRGILRTWNDVAPKVLGVPNAKYKSFKDPRMAKHFALHGYTPAFIPICLSNHFQKRQEV